MFSGIVEGKGIVKSIEHEGSNVHFWMGCDFTQELKIDQSIAHNGVCLTVVELNDSGYRVTAIDETLQRTNLNALSKGGMVNLERCLRIGDRLDGHMVQGHVDTVAVCISKEDLNGSWKFAFRYEEDKTMVTVPKGSICINGVSLTVVDSIKSEFSVCIIPYTYEHTNFKELEVGQTVNLEFDVIGKYIYRYLEFSNK
jgi:riboflavin synthase